ncbi:MAG TPA: hypothetical protein VNN25_05965 [Thermoanaerobaculia bacterium]|nr:hypothetical protein [Thermoanaerobaculia bacterium]
MDYAQVLLHAEFEHGKPLGDTAAVVSLPPKVIDDHEIVYRVRRAPDMKRGDLLVIEPRSTAATGELVVATRGKNAYVGHWWAKHGRKELLEHPNKHLTGEFQIIGAVNLIVRLS